MAAYRNTTPFKTREATLAELFMTWQENYAAALASENDDDNLEALGIGLKMADRELDRMMAIPSRTLIDLATKIVAVTALGDDPEGLNSTWGMQIAAEALAIFNAAYTEEAA